MREVSVYARVSPEHKLRIVDALQADGHIVAMTGDGVNDAPALKSADIGVAMGVTGTDVTKEAADMILADDNFATIVAAVREGRGIFANIRKFLRFLLSSNIGEVFTMFFGVVLAAPLGLEDTGEAIAVPLLATQILWINLLTDSAPALAIGVDPPPDDVMRRPPRRLSDRVIDREMWRGILWVGLVMAAVTLAALDLGLSGGLLGGSGEIDEARTMAFTTLVLAQLFNCFNARSDRTSAFHRLFTNPLLWGAIARLGRAPGGGGAAAVPERCLLDRAARPRRVDGLRRAREHRPLGGRGQEADRAPPAPVREIRRLLDDAARARGSFWPPSCKQILQTFGLVHRGSTSAMNRVSGGSRVAPTPARIGTEKPLRTSRAVALARDAPKSNGSATRPRL